MKRDKQVVTFVTEGEKARFNALAEHQGLSVSALVRHLVAREIVRVGLWDKPEIQDSITLDRQEGVPRET